MHGGDVDACASSRHRAEPVPDSEDGNLRNPKAAVKLNFFNRHIFPKVAKLLSKLNIRSSNSSAKGNDAHQNSSLPGSTAHDRNVDARRRTPSIFEETPFADTECYVEPNLQPKLPKSRLQENDKIVEHQLEEMTMAGPDGEDEQLPVKTLLPNVGGVVDISHGNPSPSGRGDHESSSLIDCEIHWDDLQLGEEVRKGSYGVVYRGLWNGSDVAIKVFFGSDYNEEIL